MTERNYNRERNRHIINLFNQGVQVKSIARLLQEQFPGLTLHIVYHVVEMFPSSQSCEILRNENIDSNESTV